MNFFQPSLQGHSGTKVRYVNRPCFPRKNTRIFTKMGEIHDLFVLALSLVWFAGATPDMKWVRILRMESLESTCRSPSRQTDPYLNMQTRPFLVFSCYVFFFLCFEALKMPLKSVLLRPQNWSRLKPYLLLKHYYRRQGFPRILRVWHR